MYELILSLALMADTKIERTIVRDRCTYTCIRTYAYERQGLCIVRLERTHRHVPNEFGRIIAEPEAPPVPKPAPMPE